MKKGHTAKRKGERKSKHGNGKRNSKLTDSVYRQSLEKKKSI